MALYRDIGIGIVVANKTRSSDEIMVTSIDYFPAMDGELEPSINMVEIKGKDQYGREYAGTTPNTNHITAKWYRGDSLNVVPPDVRRGEKVLIKQLANTDNYYWSTTGFNSATLRRKESVLFHLNNNPDHSKENTGTVNDNYIVEASTHEKFIKIKTSKSDGEPFAYDIQVNTKTGNILITDDVNNTFELDSAEKRMMIRNSEGCMLEINKKNMNINVVEYLNVKVGKDASFNIGKNSNWNIGESLNEKIAKSINSDSGQTVNFKAGQTVDLTAGNSVNATAPLIGENGNIVQNRGVGGGTATFPGTIKVTQEVEVAGIKFTQHKHNETQSVTSKPF